MVEAALIPPHDEPSLESGIDDLLPSMVLRPPTSGLGSTERKEFARQLRQSAIDAVRVANRIDPEHMDALIHMEKTTVSAISTRFKRATDLLTQRDTYISQLESAKTAAIAQLKIAQDTITAKEQEIAEKTAIIEGVKKVLGGELPTEEDAKAIEEMDAILDASELPKNNG